MVLHSVLALSVVICLSFSNLALAQPPTAEEVEKGKKELMEILKEDFFAEKIDRIFSDSRLQIDSSLFPVPDSSKKPLTEEEKRKKKIELYAQFLTEESVQRGKEFLAENRALLENVYAFSGVPPEFIVAFLRIESNFCSNLGHRPVIRTLFSLYFSRRSFWALKEMKAYITLAEEKNWNIFEKNGSKAGAMGCSQFLSSSYLAYAIDGNGDGVVDLSNKYDACFSTSFYLTENGWSELLKDRYKATLSYNPDEIYKETIFAYAELLLV